MHDSASRLYLAAQELRAVTGQTQVAQLLGIDTPQTVNNWESRGVSKDGALLAQQAIGCDANWLLSGEGAMSPGWPFTRVPVERFTALTSDGRAYVEGRLLSAIEEAEGSNGHSPAADALVYERIVRRSKLKESNKKTG